MFDTTETVETDLRFDVMAKKADILIQVDSARATIMPLTDPGFELFCNICSVPAGAQARMGRKRVPHDGSRHEHYFCALEFDHDPHDLAQRIAEDFDGIRVVVLGDESAPAIEMIPAFPH